MLVMCSIVLLLGCACSRCAQSSHVSHAAVMDLKCKVASFSQDKTKVYITDVVTGEVVRKHNVEGKIGISASVQRNIAAIVVSAPYHGVHVMHIKSGRLLCKFIPPNGRFPTVALSKDALTLAVGTYTGMSCV